MVCVLFWLTPPPTPFLFLVGPSIPRDYGSAVRCLWNFLWWTDCAALSQCVCEIFARFCCPEWHRYIVGNAHVCQNVYLIGGCLTLWRHFGPLCFVQVFLFFFIERWCFCYSFPRALDEVVFGLTGIGCKCVVEKRVNTSSIWLIDWLLDWLVGKLMESVVFLAYLSVCFL